LQVKPEFRRGGRRLGTEHAARLDLHLAGHHRHLVFGSGHHPGAGHHQAVHRELRLGALPQGRPHAHRGAVAVHPQLAGSGPVLQVDRAHGPVALVALGPMGRDPGRVEAADVVVVHRHPAAAAAALPETPRRPAVGRDPAGPGQGPHVEADAAPAAAAAVIPHAARDAVGQDRPVDLGARGCEPHQAATGTAVGPAPARAQFGRVAVVPVHGVRCPCPRVAQAPVTAA
jgi:hypothetical protein